MKKFMVALMLCLVSIMGFGQLNVQTVEEYAGYKTVCKINCVATYVGEVRFITGTGYVLFGKTDNQFEKNMTSIVLGMTKESAILTLKDIRDLKESSSVGDVLVVKGFGDKPTKIICVRDFGKNLAIKTEGVAGSSNILSYVTNTNTYYDKMVSAINAFDESQLVK